MAQCVIEEKRIISNKRKCRTQGFEGLSENVSDEGQMRVRNLVRIEHTGEGA